MWGAIAGSVVGGLIGADAQRSAAQTQARAADRATQAQERQFNKQVELQAPFREAGLAANNRLSYLLGLTPTSTAGTQLTYDQLRNELLKDYTTSSKVRAPRTGNESSGAPSNSYKTITSIDEAGLDAAIRARLAQQSEQQAYQQSISNGDPAYGSLMRNFGMSDFEADPGYAFRQQEGMKGIESGAAARGGLLSGAALKAIQKYGQDLASQEYGNAYNRYNANQTNQYNRLAGLVNTGQGATNQIGNAAANFGNAQASNIIGAGNANAAATIGNANAWNNAIGTGINAYQNNQLMDLIRNPGATNQPSIESYYGY